MTRKIKKALLITSIALISAVVPNFANANSSNYIETVSEPNVNLSTESREFASQEIETNFEINSIAFDWEDDTQNHELELFLKFYDGKWTKWYEAHPSIDAKTFENSQLKTSFLITAPASKFQYKFVYNGGAAVEVKNLRYTYFNANPQNPKNDEFEQGEMIKDSFLSFADSFNLVATTSKTMTSSLKIITRKQWGADESLRVLNKKAEPQITPQNDIDEMYEKFKDELKVVRKVTQNDKGQKLKWPLEYPEKITKIIIHHTATTNEAMVASTNVSDLQNYKQIVKNIYYYHAISRGWGDIGYHYIVDPDGRIYEGRYSEAIGAHAAGSNHGSLGIAVIGNYEENDVPDKVVNALVEIVSNRAGKYKIQADGKSKFRGKIDHNIIGHRDVSATTCPGQNLYKLIPKIRKMVANINVNLTSNLAYEFSEVSDVYAVDLNRNKTKQVTIKLKNIGQLAWGGGTYLTLDEDSTNKTLLNFPNQKGIKFALMKETYVKPGDIGTFTFNIQSKNISGVSELSLTPFIRASNRNQKILHKIYLPIFVNEPIYTYKVTGQSMPPITVKKGMLINSWIELQNTGNVTWSKYQDAVVIGADRPRDRKSVFVKSKPFERMAYMNEKEVQPGEKAKFYFHLKAPDVPGFYKEYFTPVVEGVTWMQDKQLSFSTYVYDDPYAGAIGAMTGDHNLITNKTNRIKFNIKNVGGITWRSSGINSLDIEAKAGKGVSIIKKNIPKKDVKPGEEIEVSIDIKANALAANGILEITPIVATKKIMRQPKRFYYRLASSKSSKAYSKSSSNASDEGPGSEDDIRIKLSFDEKPIITSSNGMYLYSNDKKITTYKKGDKVSVQYSSGAYRVKMGGSTRSVSKPPKFVPRTGSILEIANMERRPAWNQELNDNKFRGNLEVMIDGGKFVTINELPLEDYLKGLAENTNTENIEKIKALIVAARTYAKYYMTVAEKFKGKPWNLDDSPDVSQKYLGYGYEQRAPNVVRAISQTEDEVITFQGKLIKTPYFSSSDGKTKSAKEVWGWNDTPYLQSVDDSYCKGGTLQGHGVGLSGCGARGLANAGKTYKEILKYFYTGVQVGRQ